MCSGTGNGIDELIVLARVIMWHFIWSLTNDLVYLSFLSHQIDAWTTVMSYFFINNAKYFKIACEEFKTHLILFLT